MEQNDINSKSRNQFIEDVTNYCIECEKEPGFAGFQFEESRNKSSNQLLSVKIIPVDAIGGITAPRS
jgi:hypothetical protein